MSNLSEARNTIELHVGAEHVNYEYEAGAAVFAGGIAALNGEGKIVPASDTAGLVVLGRIEATVASGAIATARSGFYLFDNGSSSEALAVADIGKACCIVDDHTVGKVGGSNAIPAGVVVAVTGDGVLVDMTPSGLAAARAAKAAGSVITAGTAVADVAAAGEDSANLITAVNGILAALRSNGIIATE